MAKDFTSDQPREASLADRSTKERHVKDRSRLDTPVVDRKKRQSISTVTASARSPSPLPASSVQVSTWRIRRLSSWPGWL